MLPVWVARYNDIERLQHAWEAEFQQRAGGGAIALSGFHFQFLVVLHDTLRAWLERSPVERRRPSVFTEYLTDILDRSSDDFILVTQVKRTRRSDKVLESLTELWLIYDLALRTVPNLVPHLRFRILSRESKPVDFQSVLNKWHPDKSTRPEEEIKSFRKRVTVELFSDPEDEVLALLANSLRASDPTGYVHHWLGILLGAASDGKSDGFKFAARLIWSDLQSIENSSLLTAPSIYVWTNQDKTPDIISEGSVLTGERPQVHHLREGYFAPRSSVYSLIADQAQKWISNLADNQDKQLRLPVFWISGRSGSGKSIALVHTLALLHESGLGTILWLGNKTELLRQAISWALKISARNCQVIIGIDDPYAPNTQNDDIIWKEALATLESIRQDGDAAALPLIVCCGPTEQGERMRKDLPEEVNITMRELPKESQEEIFQLRNWYSHRTKKLPPEIGDENVLLVQLFFEWETGESLPQFAHRFRNRIRESDPKGALEDFIARMLCLNRLYVGYPDLSVDNQLTPALQDTFRRLREEHHITQQVKQYGTGFWLAHAHLANVIYESWYPLHNSRAVRTDHLRRAIIDSFQFGSSLSEQTAALWAISQATLDSFEQDSRVGRLDEETIINLLPSVYGSKIKMSSEWLTLAELPVWIKLHATYPKARLMPSPIDEALNQIKEENIDERGLRLTCHKLLQHYKSFSDDEQFGIKESIIQLLTKIPHWYEWAPVAEDAYRSIDDPILTKLITAWVKDYPRSSWTDRLFIALLDKESTAPQLLRVAIDLLPRVGGKPGWGDIAIRLVEYFVLEPPRSVFLWARNNCQQWGACYLLGRLLDKGYTSVIPLALEWCRRWHKERSANYVLEPLLDLVGPDERVREWCLRWIDADHQNVDDGFIVERLINTFPSDNEILSMAVQWLEQNNSHKSWPYIWSALNKVILQKGSVNQDLDIKLTSTADTSTYSPPEQNEPILTTTSHLLELIPDDPATWYNLAMAYGKAERHEEKITALKKAIELKPDYAKAWQALGATYNKIGQPEQALEATLKGVELRPDRAGAWYSLAIAYGKAERHEEKITALKKAIGLKPDYTEAWHYLAIAYGKAGRFDDEITALKKTIELRPDYAEAWQALGATYSQVGQTERALEAALKLTDLKPDSAEAWHYLAIAYSKAGRLDDEITALKKASELKPREVMVWFSLGAMYFKMNRFKESVEALRKATELKPDFVLAQRRLSESLAILEAFENQGLEPANLNTDESKKSYSTGRHHVESGKIAEASNAFRLAIQTSADVNLASLSLLQSLLREATVAFYSQAYERALILLEIIVSIDHSAITAWKLLSASYRRTGQDEEALQAAIRLIDITPIDEEAWYKLGKRYMQLGRTSEAVNAFEQALKLSPSFKPARRKLNRLTAEKK